MSTVGISQPVISRIEEEAMSLSVFYYCICAFLCRYHNSTHICVICHHFCCPITLFQGHIAFLEFYPSSASVIVLTSNLPISYDVSDLARFLYSPKHLLFAHVSTWFVWIVWSWCMHNKHMGLCGNLTLRERNIWLFSSFFTFLGW